MKLEFTKKQGQYLAFVYYYQKLNKVAPAHIDFQRYFKSDPASVNDMLKRLEKKGLIKRLSGKARSIELLIKMHELPELH